VGAAAAATQWRPARAGNAFPASRYAGAMVIDALGGPGVDDPSAAEDAPLSARALADAKASGVTAVNITVNEVGNGPDRFEKTIDDIAGVEYEIAAHPDLFLKVLRASDLKLAKTSGRMGLIYGFQDTSMLDGDLKRLEVFHNLGLRICQPTYNVRNLMGDGCLEPADAGLSNLGRQFIGEVNRLRILLDLSHAGRRTIAEGIEAAKAPMAITHTGCRALADLPRNTDDSSLKALADKGGVVGIYFMPFLRTSGQPHAEDVALHLEHAVNVCGEDHVGLGTDGTISKSQQIRYTPQKVNRKDLNEVLGNTPTPQNAHMQNFLDCIRTGKTPNWPLEVGFRTAIGCRMAVDSYRQGRTMKWDPVKEEIV